jgi:GH15 family glucan-1,4-alpha-glucosidase
MALPIEDYAIIGDCQTAALVGRDGSIDWLCLPRFDSGACFAALLGTPHHGRWLFAPAVDVRRTRRRYRTGTLILETEFETADGSATLIDCMPPRTEEPVVVRLVKGERGSVPMRLELIIRCDYGSIVPWVTRTKAGIRAIAGPDTLLMNTDVDVHGENLTPVSTFTVTPGQAVPFTLSWHASHRSPPPPTDALETVRATERWWCDWSGGC